MHRGRRPSQQLSNLRRRAAKRGSDQDALDSLVLRVAVGSLKETLHNSTARMHIVILFTYH
jgi:hypothetical protein